MLENLLKELGFNEKEIQVYLAILKHGKVTPAHIARITGIKRPTVYSTVKELLEKGVIVEDLGEGQSFLLALPPEDLQNVIRRDEQKIEEKKRLVGKAIEELQEFAKKTPYTIPKIQFVYEEDLEKFLYKQAPLWNESVLLSDGIWWGFQDVSFVGNYQKWVDWFWSKHAPREVSLKLLSNQSEIEVEMAKRKYERRVIRYWDKAGKFTATTWVCGDYLILVSTAEHPHYLVQINDKVLAHNMREVFKGIWKSL